MGSTSKKGRATINPSDPSALGICDRCGFLYNLRDLRFQYDWQGTGMVNRNLRVCRTCYDVPQEQKRVIILPPDPPPVWQPRPEPFSVEEANELTLTKIIGTPFMLFDNGFMLADLTIEPAVVIAGEDGVGIAGEDGVAIAGDR